MGYKRIEVEVPEGLGWDPGTPKRTQRHNAELPWFIGAHYGRELLLMRDHGKPLATVHEDEWPRWEATAIGQGWGVYAAEGRSSYIVVKQGMHGRFLMLAKTLNMRARRQISERTWSMRMGLLLGYPRDHIRLFIEEKFPSPVKIRAA